MEKISLLNTFNIFLITFFPLLIILLYKPVLRKISALIMSYAKEYIKIHRPNRIILIRHGESEANIDQTIYTHTPDNKISLTELGKLQAEEASKKLKQIIDEETVKFYVSPYVRGKQTFEIIKNKFNPAKVRYEIDPRLREQEFGNFKDKNPEVVKAVFQERRKIGKFYYRFLNGESGADVYDRATLFMDTLIREMNDINKSKSQNIVLVCHGLFMRLFIMRFMKLSIEKFDLLANPTNCDIWILEKSPTGSFELKTELKEDPTYSD